MQVGVEEAAPPPNEGSRIRCYDRIVDVKADSFVDRAGKDWGIFERE